MMKSFHKIGLALVILMIWLTPGIKSYATEINASIPSNWAKREIAQAKEFNLLPDELQGNYTVSITREEFSELTVKLYQALSGNESLAGNKNPFTDTQNPEVLAANNLGIVNAIGGGKFAPHLTATREEVSVMLYRTLQVAKPEYTLSNKNKYIFSDQNSISSWAQESVAYLHQEGVISGVGDNQFNPERDTSREEAIALVKRVYERFSLSENKEIPVHHEIGKINSENPTISRGDTLNLKFDMLKSLISKEMGKPYQWAGTGSDSYDCSGLVYSLFGKMGISLPRVSRDQAKVGTYIPKEDLIYGDLVFFARDGKNVHHVGIYVGNGEFVHAPSTGDVVKVSTIMSGYYANTYYTGRRIIQ
jgi:hypothetical protein